MNGLEGIQESIKNFICEKSQMQQQIVEIEEKRTQLAQQRNEKKKSNSDWSEINELGKQIAELGNQSQELQNKLDFKFHEVKTQTNLAIDNLIAEGIRGIRRINEEVQELEESIANQKERNAKYELQKQEFFERFGRMPELSENAIKDSKLQEEKSTKNAIEIEELKLQVKKSEDEITELARIKREFKNGNWSSIIEGEDTSEEICVEPLTIEEIEPIEEISVEEFVQPEEIYVEEFEPIEELHIEEFKEVDETQIESESVIETVEEKTTIDEIEELARAIVEEIVAEQTRDLNINKIEEQENIQDDVDAIIEEAVPEDIIVFEKEEEGVEQKEKARIPLFWQKATISNIIVKIEENELVYKAQMSDEKEIKIYPAKLGEESVLLRDKQNREECKEILINYAVSEYKTFDKKVVNKIDPLVCELLIECAERYNYEAQELIYNYAMSFSKSEENDAEEVPNIIYNLSYIEESNLSRKEKAIINKICKNTKKNNKIDIIETFSGFKKIKYVFKRLFAVNNVKVLPEAKY